MILDPFFGSGLGVLLGGFHWLPQGAAGGAVESIESILVELQVQKNDMTWAMVNTHG